MDTLVSKMSHLTLSTPLDVATILQDLKVLPQLKNVRFGYGDIPIMPDRGWGTRSSPIIPYETLQDLLEELKTLPDTYDEEKWMQFSKPFCGDNMDMAKLIRTVIPDIFRGTHRVIATIMSQLSPCVQEGLRAGLSFQTMEEALDSKLQDINYTFCHKD